MHLPTLRALGLIRFEGPSKTGRYLLVKIPRAAQAASSPRTRPSPTGRSLVELREIPASYEDAAANLSHVAQRIRARDLVELADGRIMSLKAARFAWRGR